MKRKLSRWTVRKIQTDERVNERKEREKSKGHESNIKRSVEVNKSVEKSEARHSTEER